MVKETESSKKQDKTNTTDKVDLLAVLEEHRFKNWLKTPEGQEWQAKQKELETLSGRGDAIQYLINVKQKQNDFEVIVDKENKKVYVKNKSTGEQTSNFGIICKWLNVILENKKLPN